MTLTYYGHACFLIETKGKKILFDPFITPNDLAKHIDINKVEADYIFLSHGHGDHIADCVHIAQKTGATCVGAFEVMSWLQSKGISKTHPMNHGGQWCFDFGVVKCVHAVHSSSMPDGSYGGNPMGFVFTTEEGNFYYSGDTALTMDMQLIPHWAKLDFTVMPVGDNFTMGVTDAIRAADFVQCSTVVGVHYDTFGFIKIDHAKAINDFKIAEKKLLLLRIGEEMKIL